MSDASDLTVYFDEDYLLTGQTNTVTQANYWLLDEDSPDLSTPLLNIERNGVSLTVDGEPFDLIIAETRLTFRTPGRALPLLCRLRSISVQPTVIRLLKV